MTSVSDDLPRIPPPALIGDIGGTNARFALVTGDGMTRFPDEQGADYATIDDAIARALDHSGARPRSAVLALAGPIQGDAVAMTNSPWVVEPKRLIKRFGFEDEAPKIQDAFLAGNQREAYALVPDAFVDDVALVGPPERIRDKLAAWRESGVTTLLVQSRDPVSLRTMAELVL